MFDEFGGNFGPEYSRWLLFCVQLVQPVLHVAEGAKQAQPRLAEVESRIQCVLEFLALVNAGQLLRLWSQLRWRARPNAGSKGFQNA